MNPENSRRDRRSFFGGPQERARALFVEWQMRARKLDRKKQRDRVPSEVNLKRIPFCSALPFFSFPVWKVSLAIVSSSVKSECVSWLIRESYANLICVRLRMFITCKESPDVEAQGVISV